MWGIVNPRPPQLAVSFILSRACDVAYWHIASVTALHQFVGRLSGHIADIVETDLNDPIQTSIVWCAFIILWEQVRRHNRQLNLTVVYCSSHLASPYQG